MNTSIANAMELAAEKKTLDKQVVNPDLSLREKRGKYNHGV